MTKDLWRLLDSKISLLGLASLCSLAVILASTPIKDIDIWLHLAAGRFTVLHKFVPTVDVLSCTINGQPWTNHEWLFQLIIYILHTFGGFKALLAFRAVSALTIFILLVGLDRRKSGSLIGIGALMCVFFTFQMRFNLRPDLLSVIFLVAYLFLINKHLKNTKLAPVVFCLQVMWTNMHGYFFLGPLLFVLLLLGEWMKVFTRKVLYHKSLIPRLNGLVILSLLATCINPQFIKGALYPWHVLSTLGHSELLFINIQELRPPVTWNSIFAVDQFIFYKALIVLSFAGLLENFRRVHWGDIFLWLLFLAFSLAAVRNIMFFAVVAYAVIIKNLSLDQEQKKRTSSKTIVVGTLKVCVVAYLAYSVIVRTASLFNLPPEHQKSVDHGLFLKGYPAQAVDFLTDNDIKGNFFNDFNSGAYLLGRRFPDIKVFIDGRTEVYGMEFYKYYKKIWKGDWALFQEASQKYGLTGVFFTSVYKPLPMTIIGHLLQAPEWSLVYFGKDAVIFLKDIPENQPVIDRYKISNISIEYSN